MPDARQPDLKNGAAAPGVVFGIRPRGMLPPFHKRANAAGNILMVDQGYAKNTKSLLYTDLCFRGNEATYNIII